MDERYSLEQERRNPFEMRMVDGRMVEMPKAEYLADMAQIVAAKPNDKQMRQWYAEALTTSRQFSEALEQWLELIQLRSDACAYSYRMAAGVLRALQRIDEAEVMQRRAEEVAPSDLLWQLNIRYMAALELQRAGLPSEELAPLQEAIREAIENIPWKCGTFAVNKDLDDPLAHIRGERPQ